MRPLLLCTNGRETDLAGVSLPLDFGPPRAPLEVEIGFGKGRYLLARAAADPGRRFLGIESAAFYYKLVNRRAVRGGLQNLTTLCGDALYVLSTCLAPGSAEVVHVYFPDPWPKSRHHRRRLFDDNSVDLLLGLLSPTGRLFFATDHREYGEAVVDLLASERGVEVEYIREAWPDGLRTNYELKYEGEGRDILRLVVRRSAGLPTLLSTARKVALSAGISGDGARNV